MGILTQGVTSGTKTLAGKTGRGKLKHRPRRRSGIGLFVRVITRPHHGPGLNMAETEAQSLVSQIREFIGLVETGDGQVILRGPQILPDSKNVDAARA